MAMFRLLHRIIGY